MRPSKKKPRFYAGFGYIPQVERSFEKTVEVLGTPGLPRLFGFWKIAVKQQSGTDRRKKKPNLAVL